MKTPRERERKAPKGLYHGPVQLSNWEARIVASTVEDCQSRPLWRGRNVVAVLVTYPNDQCGLIQLTAEEFRSLTWLESLHVDAITFITSDAERRWILEAIQVQGVPEMIDVDAFDKICNDVFETLFDEQRLREGTWIAA